jgi:hypothetical protein
MLAEQALHNGGMAVYWSDAAIHTVGMLGYLQQHEVEWLGDVLYSAKMNKKGVIAAQPKSTPEAPKHSMTTGTAQSQSQSHSLPQLNKLFQPQRFGWLGGDVATSCALPSLLETSSSAKLTPVLVSKGKEMGVSSRYIWLFGDSLIGTSSATRCVFYYIM